MVSARRLLFVALAIIGTVILVLPTGGFSASSLDRSISVAVADDPNEALIGTAGTHRISLVTNETEPVDLLTVTNHLGYSVDVVATAVGTSGTSGTETEIRNVGVSKKTLSPEEQSVVSADVVCTAPRDETWTIEIIASGDSFKTKILWTVQYSCQPPHTKTAGPAATTVAD